MANVEAYQLNFRAPLHVGERGVGLEESRTTVAADTLFSAVCVMWRELYGEGELIKLLDEFTRPQVLTKPFYLTSAFPVAGAVRFYPRPCLAAEQQPKAQRRVQFVSERIFTQIVNGKMPEFNAADCINEGEAWIDEADRADLQAWATATNDIVLWRKQVVPRVALDRLTSASNIWHCGSVVFAQGAQNESVGLWFAAQVQFGWRARFTATLRLLGDAGLGGERGVGYGLFNLSGPQEFVLPSAAAAQHFVTLSPCTPRDGDEVAALLDNAQVAYELTSRRGWVGSPEASNLRRKQVWMFREGAVLNGAPRFVGSLANVTPEPCPHPVWRYGWAFPVGVHLS